MLVITGGIGADTITVATISGGNGSNGARVTGALNGSSVNQTFSQSLTRIRVSTAAGNDSITINSGITLPTALDGGTGNDTINGAAGPT